jgi:hypothetical protein
MAINDFPSLAVSLPGHNLPPTKKQWWLLNCAFSVWCIFFLCLPIFSYPMFLFFFAGKWVGGEWGYSQVTHLPGHHRMALSHYKGHSVLWTPTTPSVCFSGLDIAGHPKYD